MKRRIRERLRVRSTALEHSEKTLRDIYTITFSDTALPMCETNDGFRIRTYSYGDVHTLIEKAAAVLYDRVGTDTYIALEMENSVMWVVAFWAILRSGNKPYLVNMRYPASMSRSILQTLSIKYSVCDTTSSLGVEAISAKGLADDAPAVPEDVFGDELAFSSSATSMKEVICFYSGKQICAQIENFRSIVKTDPRIADHYNGALKQLAFLPFYHIFGLFAVFFWFTFFGTTLVFLRDYGADTILKTCRRHQVTHIFAVPLLWHTIESKVMSEIAKKDEKIRRRFKRGLALCTSLQNAFPGIGRTVAKHMMREVTDAVFGPSVQFCISGGSYVRDSALELLCGIGYNLRNGYGMSEIGITSVELRKPPKSLCLNSIGAPFDAVEYRIGERGTLEVRGSTLCAKKIVNGEPVDIPAWFDTEDIADVTDGRYYIRGRMSDTVIADNGENINPDTMESQLLLPGAVAFSVLGLPHEHGEVLSLVVQIDPLMSAARREELLTAIDCFNAALPPIRMLRRVLFTTDALLPPTAVKVSRARLREQIVSGALTVIPREEILSLSAVEETHSPLAQTINAIIAEVLDIDPSSIRDDAHLIMDLGASSMQYFAILAKLAQTFESVTVKESDSYQYTPKGIRDFIEAQL